MKLKIFYLAVKCLMLSFSMISADPKKLKILFVLHEFPKFNQPFILNQITGLIDRGHDVHIYANTSRYKIISHDVQRYRLLSKTYYGKIPSNIKDFDIIYCQFGIDGYVGLKLKKKYNLTGKLVTCFRGDDITQFLKPHPNGDRYRMRGSFKIPCYFSKMYDELFKKGDFFLPVCEYFAQKAILYGCDPRKIKVHHSAIDLKKYPYRPRIVSNRFPVRILCVARLVEMKGVHILIRAVGEYCKKNFGKRKCKLFIVGDGPDKSYLKMLVKKLRLQNVVKFLGWQPHEKIYNYLLSSHIFVLPSITTKEGTKEGIPNVLMEAMATGMPVISTYHSGIPELIQNGISGCLVGEKKVLELAEKLNFLINNHAKWERFGKKARKHIEKNHNIKKENEDLEKILYQVLAE